MNNMIIMSSFNTHAYLYCNADCLLIRQSGLLLNIFFQGDSFYQLHYNIIDTVLLTYIIHIHNIGMGKACCRLRLRPELGNKVFVLGKFLLQNLNRHKTIQLMTFCFIYIRHATGTDLFQNLVAVTYHHTNLYHRQSPLNLSTTVMQEGQSAPRKYYPYHHFCLPHPQGSEPFPPGPSPSSQSCGFLRPPAYSSGRPNTSESNHRA